MSDASTTPWARALEARRHIARDPSDAAAHAELGHALVAMEWFQAGARSYERALQLEPQNPYLAHNLGHLYDVALGRPEDALPLLEFAVNDVDHTDADAHRDFAVSYAHALARVSDFGAARRVLQEACGEVPENPTHQRLMTWIVAMSP